LAELNDSFQIKKKAKRARKAKNQKSKNKLELSQAQPVLEIN